jgi:hypothetical protein
MRTINHFGVKRRTTVYFAKDEKEYLKLQARLYSEILRKKISVSEVTRILIFGKAVIDDKSTS